MNCLAPETILTERIPAALFLAADESGWITGMVIDVAGGAVMV